MKFLLFLIVVAFVTCATTTPREKYRSTEDNSYSEDEDSSIEVKDSSTGTEDSSSSETNSGSSESLECKISYTYTLWIGDNVDEIHSVHLHSKCGTVLLNTMQQASQERKEFAFEHTTHPLFGAFVTKIDGVSNDEEARKFWMIYDLTKHPDVDNAPDDDALCSVGVSSLEVLDGHSYLFWYRTFNGKRAEKKMNDYNDDEEDEDYD